MGEISFLDIKTDRINNINISDFATDEEVKNELEKKVNKENGKSLLLDSEITRLSTLVNYAHPISHPSSMITGLPKVATSGNYDDLVNKPIIPIVDVTKNYVDGQDLKKVDKVDGKSLILDTEAKRLFEKVTESDIDKWNNNIYKTPSLDNVLAIGNSLNLNSNKNIIVNYIENPNSNDITKYQVSTEPLTFYQSVPPLDTPFKIDDVTLQFKFYKLGQGVTTKIDNIQIPKEIIGRRIALIFDVSGNEQNKPQLFEDKLVLFDDTTSKDIPSDIFVEHSMGGVNLALLIYFTPTSQSCGIMFKEGNDLSYCNGSFIITSEVKIASAPMFVNNLFNKNLMPPIRNSVILYVTEDGDDKNDGLSVHTSFATFKPVIDYLSNNKENDPIEIRIGGSIADVLDLRGFTRQSINITGRWSSEDVTCKGCEVGKISLDNIPSNVSLSYINAESFSFKTIPPTNQLLISNCNAVCNNQEIVKYFGFLFGNISNAIMRNCSVNNIKDAVVLQGSNVDIYSIRGDKIITPFTLVKNSTVFVNKSQLNGSEPNKIDSSCVLEEFAKYRYSLVNKGEENGTMKIDGRQVLVYSHPSGTNPHGTTKADIGLDSVDDVKQIPLSYMGIANGVATLDALGKVPSTQLPSFVESILEFPTRNDFPPVGKDKTLYLAKDTKIYYRWSGTDYIPIPSSSVQSVNGKTGNVVIDKKDVGLDKVDNTADVDKFVNGANRIVCNDTRDTNFLPEFYLASQSHSTVNEFKDSEIIGLSAKFPEVRSFVSVQTHTPWGDKSGGLPMQTAYSGIYIYTRFAVHETEWGMWSKQLTNYDVVDYIISSTKDKHTWSNIYKNGRVEQGDYCEVTGTKESKIIFPIPMEDEYYHVNLCIYSVNGGNGVDAVYCRDKTATSMIIVSDYHTSSYKVGVFWEVKGNRA